MLKQRPLITGLSTKLTAFNLTFGVTAGSNKTAEFWRIFQCDVVSSYSPFITLLFINTFTPLLGVHLSFSRQIDVGGCVHVGHFSSSSRTTWFSLGAACSMPAGTYRVTCGPALGQYLPTLKPFINSWPCIHHNRLLQQQQQQCNFLPPNFSNPRRRWPLLPTPEGEGKIWGYDPPSPKDNWHWIAYLEPATHVSERVRRTSCCCWRQHKTSRVHSWLID